MMLVLPKPMSRTVTKMLCTSHVLHKPFKGFPERCQEDSVSPLLLILVNMVLEGPSFKDQMAEKHRQQHLQLLS